MDFTCFTDIFSIKAQICMYHFQPKLGFISFSQSTGRANNYQIIYCMNNIAAKRSRTWCSQILMLVCHGWVPLKAKVSDCCLDLHLFLMPILLELFLSILSSARDPSATKQFYDLWKDFNNSKVKIQKWISCAMACLLNVTFFRHHVAALKEVA